MHQILIIGGLTVLLFDALKQHSTKRFSPNGTMMSNPVKKPGYPREQGHRYLEAMQTQVSLLREHEPVSVLLSYVDYGDQSTADFIKPFFPFALVRPLRMFNLDENAGKVRKATALSEYVEYLTHEARELRRRAGIIREQTHVHNLTPLLLPERNFRSKYHDTMMNNLFSQLGSADDPRSVIDREISEFLRHHPRTRPPKETKSCFSDGDLFFRSPGNHRHGYYRHVGKAGHVAACLLNAKSRFGGTYDHTFHYDCLPVKGSLANHYPNCHEAPTPPKERHVNIAPNDYVI